MSRKPRRNTWCRYRTPFTDEHKTCEVGVDFHVFQTGNGIRHMPCLGESPEAIARCPKYSSWTEDEIAAQELEREKRWKRMSLIRSAIVESIGKSGVRHGTISCPACKIGTVVFAQADNGHVHARCTTKDCAAWME